MKKLYHGIYTTLELCGHNYSRMLTPQSQGENMNLENFRLRPEWATSALA